MVHIAAWSELTPFLVGVFAADVSLLTTSAFPEVLCQIFGWLLLLIQVPLEVVDDPVAQLRGVDGGERRAGKASVPIFAFQ